MASQSQGIQQLLQAEKRAAEKVAEARKRKLFSRMFVIWMNRLGADLASASGLVIKTWTTAMRLN